MTVETAAIAAILAYCLSAGLWVFRQNRGLNIVLPQVFALLALSAHALTHGLYWHMNHGPDVHFFAALSRTTLAMAAITAG